MSTNLQSPGFDIRQPESGVRATGPVTAGNWRLRMVVAFALAALTLLVYLPVRHHGFVLFDDADYVSDNGMVQGGLTWEGTKWAFTTTRAANWHPVTWLSHMLDASLNRCLVASLNPDTGSTRKPFNASMVPHEVNVLLHAINTVLLFILLQKSTGAPWRSASVAALFALHPLHVESVAWIAERKDVLSAFFFLLALGAYGCYVTQRSRGLRVAAGMGYGAALLLYALGLMTKPMLVTLPFVLLLVDYWPLGRFTIYGLRPAILPLVREKLPFFALAVASSAATLIAQHNGGAVRTLENFSLGERIANAVVSYAQYLGKAIWPVDLAVFYPHPGHWPPAQVAFAALLVAGLSYAALWFVREFPFAAVGWFWFAGMLVPTIGLVQVGNQSMADRYTYLPLIGVFIGLVWGANEAAVRFRFSWKVAGTAGAAVVIACTVVTELQLRHWRNAESLSRHALAVTRNNFVAHNYLASALLEEGRADEAIAEFRDALSIQPRFADAHCNLGNALLQKDRPEEAMAQYRTALEFKPDHPLARYNLGTVLLQLGRVDDAAGQFQKVLELLPDDVLAHLNLGNARLQQNRVDEAISQYRRILEIRPDCADAHNNLGTALLRAGCVDEAVGHFQQALRIQPGHANAHHNLGDVFLRQGRAGEAIAHYRKVLEVQPEDADARRNLEHALGSRQNASGSLRQTSHETTAREN